MNVETKEFWLKVKEEYQPSSDPYICKYSQTFYNMWNDISHRRQDIKVIRYARNFLEERIIDDFSCQYGVLFSNDLICNHIHIEIRKQFIDHMINKFS